MYSSSRQQLTLFTNPTEAETIECIRKTFNPIQFHLIQSHVTLCREHELTHYTSLLLERLHQLRFPAFTLKLLAPIRFANKQGVYIPFADTEAFFNLREILLNGLPFSSKDQEPHLTLLHPRNATCTDTIYETILNTQLPEYLTFNRVHLIEQKNGHPWHRLSTFEFNAY